MEINRRKKQVSLSGITGFALAIFSLNTSNASSWPSQDQNASELFPLTEKQKTKYHAPTMVCYHFDQPDALETLREAYHFLPMPPVIFSILNLPGNSEDGKIARNFSRAFAWTFHHNYVLSVNVGQVDLEWNELNPLSQIKSQEGGLSLGGWYIPREFLKDTPFEQLIMHGGVEQNAPSPSPPPRFIDLENASPMQERYLVTPLDLTSDHIDYLKGIKSFTLNKLSSIYEVDPTQDQVRMYFHFPYDQSTTSLHLHVRVNQGRPPLEQAKSFDIDDVIQALATGKQFSDLVLERQNSDERRSEIQGKCLYANQGAEATIRSFSIPGIHVREVKNTFIDK